MPLNDEQKKLRKEIYQRLDDRALEPGNPLYVPIYGQPGCEDPVRLIQDHIELSAEQSFQLFSGFRGSGKTTELLRLKQRLEQQGFLVLYADALEYVNPSEPIDISDFLIVLGGAFGDALLAEPVFKEHQLALARSSYWQRITEFLGSIRVNAAEATLKSSVTGPIEAGVELKLELRTSPTFRQNVQRLLASRIGELRNEAHKFFEDGVKAVREFYDEDKQVVFIFDSFDQLRGSLSNEKEVLQSVERLFANHLTDIRIPYVHCVFTVPPWFKFLKIGGGRLNVLPSIRQWNNDSERTRFAPGWDALRKFVEKRFGYAGHAQFFGADADTARNACEEMVGVCGGDFRDLLRLLREAVLRAEEWPVTPQNLERARLEVLSQFLPIALDDAVWLSKIAELRDCWYPSTESETISHLTRFFDLHYVLYLRNGEEWYDIHPLIRDEVAAIVQRQAKNGQSDDTTQSAE